MNSIVSKVISTCVDKKAQQNQNQTKIKTLLPVQCIALQMRAWCRQTGKVSITGKNTIFTLKQHCAKSSLSSVLSAGLYSNRKSETFFIFCHFVILFNQYSFYSDKVRRFDAFQHISNFISVYFAYDSKRDRCGSPEIDFFVCHIFATVVP